MARQQPYGTRTVNKNGYSTIKTKNGWEFEHHLIAAEQLGRPHDPKTERVIFVDGDRTNMDPENIRVVPKRDGREQKIERLKTRITLAAEELEELGVKVKVSYSR